MTISADDLASWNEWIGRVETSIELLDVNVLRRYAAALSEDLDVEAVLPSLAHWAFFLTVAPGDGLGPDGHPRRGGFLPPVSLPRRMFAGSDMSFGEPLFLGEPAKRVSTIASVEHKSGRSGDLVLVEIEHAITQDDVMRVRERQTLVYRNEGAPTPPVVSTGSDGNSDQGDWLWEPNPVELFRFSAVTFNSHRIHYDRTYTTGVEGYPSLVVHGPLTAAKLYRQLARERRPTRFSFRALSPLFAEQPVRIMRDPVPGAISAVRCDGTTAMRATATY